jgi:hypothetical protein
MAQHPRLGHICRICRVVAEPTLELQISNPLTLRAFVVPTLDEQDLRPLIRSRTLRGSDLLEPLARATRGGGYPYREPGHLMTAVVAAVVRNGHAFSGSATTSVVDDVGGGCDGAPRPFGCCAVMIVRARTSGRFSTVGPVC